MIWHMNSTCSAGTGKLNAAWSYWPIILPGKKKLHNNFDGLMPNFAEMDGQRCSTAASNAQFEAI